LYAQQGSQRFCVFTIGKRKLDMMRTLGADHVIDYTKEDFTQHGQKYNLIFDVKQIVLFLIISVHYTRMVCM